MRPCSHAHPPAPAHIPELPLFSVIAVMNRLDHARISSSLKDTQASLVSPWLPYQLHMPYQMHTLHNSILCLHLKQSCYTAAGL